MLAPCEAQFSTRAFVQRGFPGTDGRHHSNQFAFAALKADGAVTAWGSSSYGGSGAPTDTGYTALYSTSYAFAAVKADGAVTAWGGSGGSGAPTDTGYTALYSTSYAFAAVKADGAVTAWGGSGGSGAPTDTGYALSDWTSFDMHSRPMPPPPPPPPPSPPSPPSPSPPPPSASPSLPPPSGSPSPPPLSASTSPAAAAAAAHHPSFQLLSTSGVCRTDDQNKGNFDEDWGMSYMACHDKALYATYFTGFEYAVEGKKSRCKLFKGPILSTLPVGGARCYKKASKTELGPHKKRL